jgi:hypothetical protein
MIYATKQRKRERRDLGVPLHAWGRPLFVRRYPHPMREGRNR